MITGKINLAKLTHVVMTKKAKDGKTDIKGLFIPIALNDLFEGKEGNIYLDIIAFELKEARENQTHMLKQSFPKELREAKKDAPGIGHLNISGGHSEQPNNAAPGQVLSADDDLPF